jgi:hypothetical protein
MANYKIVAKAKPELIRRREIIKNPSSVKIIINANKSKTINTKGQSPLPSYKTAPVAPQKQSSNKSIPKSSAVSRKNASRQVTRRIVESRKKAARIEYGISNISADSLLRIKQLKNTGRGKIGVIVGNGPSILDIDIGLLKNRENIDLISINKPDPRIWPTPYWAFYDLSQLRRNEDIFNDYNGIILNSTAIKRQKANSCQVKNLGGKGFSRDLSKGLHIGRSSVFATMQIAYWFGYERIYIVGCDMNPQGKNGKLHFYGVNPDVDPNSRKERFKKEAEHYDYAADILEEHERQKFVFCSSENKWGFISKYGHMAHEECIDHILKLSKTLKESYG